MNAFVIQAGDLLVYRPTGIFGRLINIKTWHPVSHVETYVGDGKSVASRDGRGVDLYDLRLDGLVGVYRPGHGIDLKAGLDWFYRDAKGQAYDWRGIMGFTTVVPGGDHDKMFCSEFCTRFYRRCGLEPFRPEEDADKIAPFQLTISPMFNPVWTA